jgi:L-rhamnonate dehydratase
LHIEKIEVIGLAASGGPKLVDSSFFNTLVRITADNGLTGVGETDGEASVTKALIEAPTIHPYAQGLASVILGQPVDPRALWARMYHATSYLRRGAVMNAISAIDMALWDLAARAEGVPLHHLIGGKRRDRLLAYVSAYPLGETRDSVRRALDEVLVHRPRAVKLCAEASWAGAAGTERMAMALDVARSHCGDIDLMVDMYGAWQDAATARGALPVMAAAGVKWLEAPLSLDDVDGYATLSGQGVAIAAGDLGASGLAEFEGLMDRGRVDIVQPDVTVAGGITECLRIQDAARSRGKRMVMHHYKSDLLLATNLALMAVAEAPEIVEFSISTSAIRNDLCRDRIRIEDDGQIRIPEGPGLGADVDWNMVARLAV